MDVVQFSCVARLATTALLQCNLTGVLKNKYRKKNEATRSFLTSVLVVCQHMHDFNP